MKLCPNCSNLVPLGAFECECGFVFPKANHPADPKLHRAIRCKLLGSFLSAVFGWLAPLFVSILWNIPRHGLPDSEKLIVSTIFAVASSPFVFGTWILVLVPLYFRVPLNSVLWRWPVCTACGALTGAAIMSVFYLPHLHQYLFKGFVAYAAVIGGATCLFGSLTRNYFHRSCVKSRND